MNVGHSEISVFSSHHVCLGMSSLKVMFMFETNIAIYVVCLF